MKNNSHSVHQHARISCAVLAVIGLMYGCGDGNSSKPEYECGSGLMACGEYCCAECNDAGDACKEYTPEGPVGRTCSAGQENCNGQCYNLKKDPKHCGTCDNECNENETCIQGECKTSCSDGYTLIDGLCFDTNIDSEHCGEANVACSKQMFCQKGECVCYNGLNADKNGNCIDSNSDKNNCGGAGNVCPGNMVCSEGNCGCPANKFNCDNDDSNGCESDISCDEICSDGLESCGPNNCVDLTSNKENCGSCYNSCGNGMVCDDSQCRCGEGFTACGNTCVDFTKADNLHCGSCDPCDVTEQCVTGDDGSPVCKKTREIDEKFSCEPNPDEQDAVAKTECWGACLDVTTDKANCGACGKSCKSVEKCVEGACVSNCAENELICDDKCIDVLTDSDHCGSCDVKCGSNDVCKEGSCVDKADAECDLGLKMCYNSCVDLKNDVQNCGRCLNACGKDESCVDGICMINCTGEYTRCEVDENVFACFNLDNSSTHCGACESETSVCKDGQNCVGGECSCAPGFYDCDGILSNGCESSVECSCKPNETRKCWFGAEEYITRNEKNEITGAVGACKAGTQTCDSSGKFWGSCNGAVYPQEFICEDNGVTRLSIEDNADLNCNGIPDANEPCVTKCETTVSATSYIGCEYWPVFLQNQAGFSTTTNVYFDLTLVISNPSSTKEASVYVYNREAEKASSPAPFKTIKLAPGAVTVETLVGVPYGSYTFDNSKYTGTCSTPTNKTTCDANKAATEVNPDNNLKVVDYMLHGTQKTANAFRVVSSEPIVVYQFNPYGKPETHSADASLLMPKSVLGKKYLTMGFQNDKDGNADRADAITIVAVEDDTEVNVTFKADTAAGSDLVDNKAIPSASANSSKPYTYNLKRYEVLNLSQSVKLANSTGTLIEANKKIEVFGGAGCGFVPSDQEACDHLEEQLFPTSTWGTEYAAVKTHIRNTADPENDVYYILAQEDGTVLTIKGQVSPVGNKKTLDAGEKAIINSDKNFYVSANKPILVGQFMVGAHANAAGKGDPSFILNVPVQQYRTEYSFSVPSGYEEDYVTIITPKDNVIKYTGAGCKEEGASYVAGGVAYTDRDITALPPVMFEGFKSHPNSDYQYGYLNLDGGTHSLTADKPFGVVGYGFFSDTSYGYPIGLDLKELNTN